MIGTMGVTDAMVTYASSNSDNNDDENNRSIESDML
jgi:hypothetical protein